MSNKTTFLNRRVYIIGISVITLLGVLFFLNSLKYSISDITADNYSAILRRDTRQSIAKKAQAASVIFSDRHIFYDAKRLSFFPNYKRFTYKGANKYSVSLKNIANNNLYTLEYPNEESDVLVSVSISNVDNMGVIVNGKQIVDELLLKQGFLYMTSELKGHQDILILEYDNVFLIGRVIPNDNGTFFSITFELYKRKKFFKSL